MADVNARAHWRDHGCLQRRAINAVWRVGAHTPRLPFPPARIAKIVGDRMQRVGFAVPDVAVAVAVAVYGETQINAWKELRIAEGAGPTPDQRRARHSRIEIGRASCRERR